MGGIKSWIKFITRIQKLRNEEKKLLLEDNESWLKSLEWQCSIQRNKRLERPKWVPADLRESGEIISYRAIPKGNKIDRKNKSSFLLNNKRVQHHKECHLLQHWTQKFLKKWGLNESTRMQCPWNGWKQNCHYCQNLHKTSFLYG